MACSCSVPPGSELFPRHFRSGDESDEPKAVSERSRHCPTRALQARAGSRLCFMAGALVPPCLSAVVSPVCLAYFQFLLSSCLLPLPGATRSQTPSSPHFGMLSSQQIGSCFTGLGDVSTMAQLKTEALQSVRFGQAHSWEVVPITSSLLARETYVGQVILRHPKFPAWISWRTYSGQLSPYTKFTALSRTTALNTCSKRGVWPSRSMRKAKIHVSYVTPGGEREANHRPGADALALLDSSQKALSESALCGHV
jgi:hypothetical protein